jgi:carboxypeptidase PM20D1
MAERLAQSIRYQTVSHQDPAQFDGQEFLRLHEYLEQAYPQIHTRMTREVVGDYNLLYTWSGQDQDLKPILLMAHIDVVPADSGPEGGWTHPPFDGQIADGFVWGRGTMDDKNSVLGILEAVEALLREDFQPRRTIYLAFGHDEEISGHQGAAKIASLLHSRGVELEYVLDEGLSVVEGVVPFISKPVAMVGIAEKGYLSLELSVKGSPGHSSVPPQETPIGILSTAIRKLERNQLPLRIEIPARQMFSALAPEMGFGMRVVFANLWLFGGLVKWVFSRTPTTNALIRTTTAPTMLQAGVKENILPAEAKGVVNFRLLSGDTIASVTEHVRRTIGDTRVEIRPLEGLTGEASFVSATDAPGFGALVRTIHQTYSGVVITPGLVLGATDSRHYAELTDSIYRFSPLWVGPGDLERVHGTDERISITDHERSVRYYIQLIRNSDLMQD